MKMLFSSIIVAIVATFLAVSAIHVLNGGTLTEEVEIRSGVSRRRISFLKSLDGEAWIRGTIFGVLLGAINFFSPKLAGGWLWLGLVFGVITTVIMINIIYWAYHECENFTGVIFLTLLEVLIFLVSKSAYWAFVGLITQAVFWKSVIVLIPTLTLITAIGFFVVDHFEYRYQELDYPEEGDNEEEVDRKAGMHHVLAWVFMIITTGILVYVLITGIAWGNIGTAFGSTSNTTATNTTATAEESWYGFYNLSMLKDEDEDNDFNFGYNCYSEKEEASYYDANFRERLKLDPALAAADMAWLDANLGTRYIGVFYDECDEAWDKAINTAKESFMENQTDYYNNLSGFFAFLDSATKVEVKYQEGGLEDQMYMNPYTASGIPDVIVMKTDDQDGYYLVYTFIIKGEIKEVAYRIDCGFQPTNVEEVMGITPQDKPDTKEDEPGGKEPTPTPTPTPDPDPTPSYNKDKTKGTQGDVVAPNDNKGTGEDTNNGKGATTSTKDTDTSSTSYKSYDEYKKAIDEIEDANESSSNTANTPTVTPSSGTTVDSNADKGTGNGGIDTPTKITNPAQTATGQDISNADEAAGSWGGPAD